VDDALLVKELDRQHHPAHQLGLLFEGESGCGLGERRALQALHDEMRRLVVGAKTVNAGDIGVAEAGHGARLAHETRAQARIVGIARGQGLDGHLAAECLIHGEKHAAHAAGADLGHDLVSRQAFRQSGSGIDDAIDLRQRAYFPRQLRNVRAGRPAIQEIRQGFGK
jgi:hypothetical protein